MHVCPPCQSDQLVNNGSVAGKPKKLCKQCGYQLTRTTPRGNPLGMKVHCVGHTAGPAGAESNDHARHRTESLSAAPLVRALQTQVDHCLQIHRDGGSHDGPVCQVLGQWEPG